MSSQHPPPLKTFMVHGNSFKNTKYQAVIIWNIKDISMYIFVKFYSF
jgi:hypothetical protein